MAKNRFNRIKGTKDFLVAAVACAFFCLWFLRDGWFPPQRVLKDHPLQMPISMKVSGVVKSLPVSPGVDFVGDVVLAELYDKTYRKVVEEAEAAFENAKRTKSADLQEKLDAMLVARANVKACVVKSSDFTQKTSHGEDKLQGRVLEHLVKVSDPVSASQPVLLIQPKDTYYIFNKSACFLSFIGVVVALAFHRIASR